MHLWIKNSSSDGPALQQWDVEPSKEVQSDSNPMINYLSVLSFIEKHISYWINDGTWSGSYSFASHYIIELLLGDLSVLILIGFLNHFLQFVFVDVLSQLLHDCLQIFYWNVPCLFQVE